MSTQTTVVFPKSKKAFKTNDYCWADRDNSPERTHKRKKQTNMKVEKKKKHETTPESQKKEIHKHRTEDKTRL